MKLKEGYVLRNVAGSWVVLPLLGADLDGMLKLNETGVLLWNLLEQEADLEKMISAMTQVYDVSPEQAKEDACAFIAKLTKLGCVEN